MEGMGTIAVNIILEGIDSLVEKREVGVVHKRMAPELVVRESTRSLS
jgi:DNA-binding LacI/PurR family transcriptional regulator